MTQQPAECQAAIDAVKELLNTHFKEAEDSADEDGKFSLGFRVTFDRSHSPIKLKVTCRVSKITTDEPSGARWPAIISANVKRMHPYRAFLA